MDTYQKLGHGRKYWILYPQGRLNFQRYPGTTSQILFLLNWIHSQSVWFFNGVLKLHTVEYLTFDHFKMAVSFYISLAVTRDLIEVTREIYEVISEYIKSTSKVHMTFLENSLIYHIETLHSLIRYRWYWLLNKYTNDNFDKRSLKKHFYNISWINESKHHTHRVF